MNPVIAKDLILASKSAARLSMLQSVGLKLDGVAPMVDEDAVKEAMIAENAKRAILVMR
ncbi:MAG: hypothetical protein HC843_04950 [Sphingomonadales bacterium]|nr:hypothetical protein [Sphingomonadales bacterium]